MLETVKSKVGTWDAFLSHSGLGHVFGWAVRKMKTVSGFWAAKLAKGKQWPSDKEDTERDNRDLGKIIIG